MRIGTEYGGWYCAPDLLRPGQVAICCGAGEDVSFDVVLNGEFGIRIVCVDPTPRAVRHVGELLASHREGRPMRIEAGPLSYDMMGFREANFSFVPCAVWSCDGLLDLFAPKDPTHVSYSAVNLQRTSEVIRVKSRTVASIMKELEIPSLALLKLDIEGAENEVLNSMLDAGIHPQQLLIEFDQVNQPLTPLFWMEIARTLSRLRDAGYRLVHRERANFVLVLRAPVPG